MRLPRGFSLIEAMVALVLFEIAALAFVATTAVVMRDLSTADRHARAFALATDRVARLRAGVCLGGTSGSADHQNGLHEHWSVHATGSLVLVMDSVALTLPRGRIAAVVVRGWEICPA